MCCTSYSSHHHFNVKSTLFGYKIQAKQSLFSLFSHSSLSMFSLPETKSSVSVNYTAKTFSLILLSGDYVPYFFFPEYFFSRLSMGLGIIQLRGADSHFPRDTLRRHNKDRYFPSSAANKVLA